MDAVRAESSSLLVSLCTEFVNNLFSEYVTPRTCEQSCSGLRKFPVIDHLTGGPVQIAKILGMPYIRVYEVATFYTMFNRGKVTTAPQHMHCSQTVAFIVLFARVKLPFSLASLKLYSVPAPILFPMRFFVSENGSGRKYVQKLLVGIPADR